MSETARRAAAEVWRIRERTEHEAAALFARLADDLATARMPGSLVSLARRSAQDEIAHAGHCRRLVDALAPGLAPLAPARTISLGPRDLSPSRRALYASVALGCVTESLSTALLLEMQSGATVGLVRDALHVIVTDEVRHARLGWAHLAFAAEREDVSWLASGVPSMLRAALDGEPSARELSPADRRALEAWGILGRDTIARVATATVHDAIAPGLRRFGLDVALAA